MPQLKLNAPKEMPKFDIIEQTPERILSRAEYSNGLIIIFDMTANNVQISPNYNTVLNEDGSLDFDMTSPNQEFQDVKH